MEVGYNYQEIHRRVIEALRQQYPQDTIATEPGYQGRVHLKIVSEKFNGMLDRQKIELIRNFLRDKLGSVDEQGVSVVTVYGTDEL